MWDITTFRPASGEALQMARTVRKVAATNELADSRLPDFVSLSDTFGNPCLPLREHRVESFAPRVYEALRKRGEGEIFIFENPLYEYSSQYVAAADLSNRKEVRALVDESLFEGGYVIGTATPLFRWIGNFTDYGFMFTDTAMIEDIFQAPPLTTYSIASQEFRVGSSGDLLLDAEIRKLNKLWSGAG